MGEPRNPNNCSTCEHKLTPDGGHCYMFRFTPTEPCAHHTFQIERLKTMRLQFGNRVLSEVLRKQKP